MVVYASAWSRNRSSVTRSKRWQVNANPVQVSSIGRVLGSRSVLYKYLNPNFISVVTVGESNLSIFLIDSFTGVLYYHGQVDAAGAVNPRADLERFSGPMISLNILQCENWVVATYFARGADGETAPQGNSVEVVVLELFESSIPDVRISKHVLSNPEQTFRPLPLHRLTLFLRLTLSHSLSALWESPELCAQSLPAK